MAQNWKYRLKIAITLLREASGTKDLLLTLNRAERARTDLEEALHELREKAHASVPHTPDAGDQAEVKP